MYKIRNNYINYAFEKEDFIKPAKTVYKSNKSFNKISKLIKRPKVSCL